MDRGPLAPGANRNQHRPMHSRKNPAVVDIIASLTPSTEIPCCLAIFTAPACCPLLSVCCCCKDAVYVSTKRNASKYVWIRENSLEWNDPQVVFSKGSFCGIDPCMYDIKDNIRVLYYDDPMFDRISDQTRMCHECRTCLCGGRGERVQIDSPCCCNLCTRASFPCICVPVCFPLSFFPCAHRYELYLADAQKGMYDIKKAVSAARGDVLYKDQDSEAAGLKSV